MLIFSENAKLKMEAQNSTSTTRDNLEKLKRNLADVEKLIEGKNKCIVAYAKKIRLVLYSVQKLLETSDSEIYAKCANPLEYP